MIWFLTPLQLIWHIARIVYLVLRQMVGCDNLRIFTSRLDLHLFPFVPWCGWPSFKNWFTTSLTVCECNANLLKVWGSLNPPTNSFNNLQIFAWLDLHLFAFAPWCGRHSKLIYNIAHGRNHINGIGTRCYNHSWGSWIKRQECQESRVRRRNVEGRATSIRCHCKEVWPATS